MNRLCARVLMVLWMTALALGLCGCHISEKAISKQIRTNYTFTDPQFRQTMSHLLGAPLVEGNRIDTLINGEEIFPAMLKAIREAKESITLEMYIWSKGEISDAFVAALKERAYAGVRVHVIVDGLGSANLPQKSIREMEKAGVRYVKYNYPHWWRFIKRFNHRTHRKLLIVDGKVGFAGGVCIHDDWVYRSKDKRYWRDNHYRIEGPIVPQMQAAFLENWVRMRGTVLHGENYFPQTPPAGTVLAQFFQSGPHQGTESARLNFLMSIGAARKNIRIAHSYFVPDPLIMQALLEAKKRGVKIEVIVPGLLDAGIVKAAARPRWIELMDAGVEFHEYQPSLYHSKLFIVDDIWVSAGSCNFDDRSLRINDEANFNVLDEKFAKRQVEVFEMDKANSRRINPQDLKRRFITKKIYDHFWGLFRFML